MSEVVRAGEPGRDEGESKLLPCPFCGGEARWGTSDDDGHFIECCRCGASTNLTYYLKDDASQEVKQRWNRRATSESQSLRSQLAEHEEWKLKTIERLQDICEENGCPAGYNRLDFLQEYLQLEKKKQLTAEKALIDAQRGPCCREPWCEGECTCKICAPKLAIRDLEAQLEAHKRADELNREETSQWQQRAAIAQQKLATAGEVIGELHEALTDVMKLEVLTSKQWLAGSYGEVVIGAAKEALTRAEEFRKGIATKEDSCHV